MPETHNCSSNDADLPKQSFAGISRRNFLSTFAIAAASLGLTSIAQSAQAASKKYKVCATKDVKVGGASSFRVASAKNMMVLITQPKKGIFRAFDQRCTHDGYAVNSIEGKNLICQAHGALFDMDSGSVRRGPARRSLTKYTVSVEKNFVYVTIKS
jgi:nitrite reductase/ring-hydroxylating ferredoxin subunit